MVKAPVAETSIRPTGLAKVCRAETRFSPPVLAMLIFVSEPVLLTDSEPTCVASPIPPHAVAIRLAAVMVPLPKI